MNKVIQSRLNLLEERQNSPAWTYKNDPFSKKGRSYNDLISLECKFMNLVQVITLEQVIDRLHGCYSESSSKSALKKLKPPEHMVFVYLTDKRAGAIALAEAWSFDLVPVADRKISDDQKTLGRKSILSSGSEIT